MHLHTTTHCPVLSCPGKITLSIITSCQTRHHKAGQPTSNDLAAGQEGEARPHDKPIHTPHQPFSASGCKEVCMMNQMLASPDP
mmetsp:Transcript_2827/g.7393  ORF Transcript_2827/g.7393 Transcript_2827/m.7393 type:complete len:84 (-) Transcript_2827:1440-1691(-)